MKIVINSPNLKVLTFRYRRSASNCKQTKVSTKEFVSPFMTNQSKYL